MLSHSDYVETLADALKVPGVGNGIGNIIVKANLEGNRQGQTLGGDGKGGGTMVEEVRPKTPPVKITRKVKARPAVPKHLADLEDKKKKQEEARKCAVLDMQLVVLIDTREQNAAEMAAKMNQHWTMEQPPKLKAEVKVRDNWRRRKVTSDL